MNDSSVLIVNLFNAIYNILVLFSIQKLFFKSTQYPVVYILNKKEFLGLSPDFVRNSCKSNKMTPETI